MFIELATAPHSRPIAPLSLSAIERLLAAAGRHLYGGEAVSQLDHALQAACLAERDGADDTLIAACLLHDLGHIITGQGDADVGNGIDDRHQFRVLPHLQGRFNARVTVPIALHVAAKRYLCTVEPGYRTGLSPASAASLALQGGPLTTQEVRRFEASPHARAAVRLRRYDDAAKVVGMATPPLEHYLAVLERIATPD